MVLLSCGVVVSEDGARECRCVASAWPLVQEPDSLLASESSTFIYPPVGATFDGGRSRNILEGGARGSLFLSKPPPKIDSLADLQFRKGKPVQSFDGERQQRDGGEKGWWHAVEKGAG